MSVPSYPAWTEADDLPLTEGDKVRLWRENEFIRMGYTAAEAFYLATSTADLHFVARLIASGCSLKHAAQIAS
jgi:hypothetical protein